MNEATRNKNPSEERELLQIASYYCGLLPGSIVAIGGTLTLPEVSGYRRMRLRSNDVDFIVTDAGLECLLTEGDVVDLGFGNDVYGVVADDVIAAFFHKHIKGLRIPSGAFSEAVCHETSQGPIYTISGELNTALKLRRGISAKGRIYGKDALDTASTFTGMGLRGEEFDYASFADYMTSGTCVTCTLDSPFGCIRGLESGANHLPGERKEDYVQFLERCTDALKGTGQPLQCLTRAQETLDQVAESPERIAKA